MKIWVLPLEKLDMRPTAQYWHLFKNYFEKHKINYEYIEGDTVKSNLKKKYFIDPVKTNVFKMTQISNLIKRVDEIKDNDVIFDFDIWHPGLECLQYVKAFTKQKFKICGMLHAGSYDENDLLGLLGTDKWFKDLENSWFTFIDKVFVASDFHRTKLLQKREISDTQVSVIPFPIDIDGMIKKYKCLYPKQRIVFTGRLTWDKGWDIVKKYKKEFEIFVTQEHNLTKNQYYKILSESTVVFAPSRHEMYGFGIIEGMALGCIPVVPDRLSFKETVPSKYRYKHDSEIGDFLNNAILHTTDDYLYDIVKDYQAENSIKKMVEVMKTL